MLQKKATYIRLTQLKIQFEDLVRKLSSKLGQASVVILWTISSALLFAFLWVIFFKETEGIIALFLFTIYFFIVFGRHLPRMKTVYFDDAFLYVGNLGERKIDLLDVQEVKDNYLIVTANNSEERIYFNHFFISNNIFKLKRTIAEKKHRKLNYSS